MNPSPTVPVAVDRSTAVAEPAPASRWPTVVQVVVAPVLLVLALVAPVLLTLLPGVRRVDEPAVPAWVAAVATIVLSALVLASAVGAVWVAARLDGRRRLADVGWRWGRGDLRPFLVGLGVAAVVLLVVGLPLTAAGALRPDDTAAASAPLGLALAVGLAQAFLLQGVPEELIFRGYLLRSLRLRPEVAVLVSGLAFGVIHLVSQGGQQGWAERLAYLAMPTGFGLAAGALVLVTRSLWAGVGVHGGLHLTVLVVGLLAAHGVGRPIGNGPALWCLTGLAWTLIAVVVLVRRRHREHRGR